MRIPRHIYQTYVQRTPFMASWQQQPGWQHHFFDDVACRRFVQQHLGPTVYAAYMRLTPGAARADLWRYCVLWVRGGIYADLYRLQFRDGKTVSDARGLSALSAKKRRERARQPNLFQRIGAVFFN